MCQVSGIRHRGSGAGLEISGIKYHISNIRFQLSGVRCQMSGIMISIMGHQLPGIIFRYQVSTNQLSVVWCRVPGIGCQIQSIRYQEPESIGPEVSGTRCRVSGITNQVSGIKCPISIRKQMKYREGHTVCQPRWWRRRQGTGKSPHRRASAMKGNSG